MIALLLLFFLLILPARGEIPPERLEATLPELEAYVEQGRRDWNVSAVAVGIVHHDELVYFRGFGQKSPADPTPPDQDTLFAIGSTTKAFAAATLAMLVDEGKLAWDQRVLDVLPEFRMFDPWVTREFRVADLLAQHSGMAPYALTTFGCLGYSPDDIVAAMAHLEPVTSFRSAFAYVNVPHMVAGRIVARRSGEPDWETFLRKRLLEPLGMRRTSWTAEAFNREPNRAVGHLTRDGRSVPVPASTFPYVFGPAGALNSTVGDVARWVRLQLAGGTFGGRELIGRANLETTRSPQTPLGPTAAYCMGWLITYQSPHPVIWHNGGTPGHRSFIGLLPAEDIAIIVLTNNGAADLSDAVGLWFFDRLQGVAGPDYSARYLERAREARAEESAFLTPPSGAAPPRPLAEYAGTYRSPVFGDVQITAGERLGLKLLRTGAEGFLDPFDGDVFVARMTTPWVQDNGAAIVGKWTFARGPEGGYETLRLMAGDGESGCVSPAIRLSGGR